MKRGVLPPNLKRRLAAIVSDRRVSTSNETLMAYECDALTHFKQQPLAVIWPDTADQVSEIVRACVDEDVPFTPRGAGTGLSGGALPAIDGGILIDTSRMTRILEIDAENRVARVEPGLINARLSAAVQPLGLYYAPDPSSQLTCTIGGNVAENSGGPHCLKYGSTRRHVLSIELVLPDGERAAIGTPSGRAHGVDLVSAIVGSEGTLGVVTAVTVRLLKQPDTTETLLAAFPTLPHACNVVSAMVASGVRASAIEALDQRTIEAVEASVFAAGYPPDAGAVLLVELDGPELEVAADRSDIEEIFYDHNALSVEVAHDAEHRKRLWKGRKGAFGAMGRIAPDLYVMDAVVPRSRLAEITRTITDICDRHELKMANVLHAGEGNLHPNICYDGRDSDEVARVHLANREIVLACLKVGGALTGEHGVGVEKKEFMELFCGAATLDLMQRFRTALNPSNLCNPGKMLPTPRACTEPTGNSGLPSPSEAKGNHDD